MSPRKQNAAALLLIAIGFFIGARYFLSDPHKEPLHVSIPYVDQLELFKCPFKAATEIPCPVCGITKSSALMVRGQWYRSWRAYPLGPFFVLTMLLLIPYSLWILATRDPDPRSLDHEKIARRNRAISLAVLVIILIAWGITLARHFQLIQW